MAETHPFPSALLARLAPFEGSFHAHKLAAEGAEVLLASYAAGEHIPAHGFLAAMTLATRGPFLPIEIVVDHRLTLFFDYL